MAHLRVRSPVRQVGTVTRSLLAFGPQGQRGILKARWGVWHVSEQPRNPSGRPLTGEKAEQAGEQGRIGLRRSILFKIFNAGITRGLGDVIGALE